MTLTYSPLVMSAWLGLTLALGSFSAIAVWAAPRYRYAIIVSGLVSALVAYGLLSVPLGHPTSATLPEGELTVLGGRIDVDKAIYVLVSVPGEDEPVFYVLPYSAKAANQLQETMDAVQKGEANGIKMKGGGDQDAPQGFEFYPEPQQPDPPKAPQQAPQISG